MFCGRNRTVPESRNKSGSATIVENRTRCAVVVMDCSRQGAGVERAAYRETRSGGAAILIVARDYVKWTGPGAPVLAISRKAPQM